LRAPAPAPAPATATATACAPPVLGIPVLTATVLSAATLSASVATTSALLFLLGRGARLLVRRPVLDSVTDVVFLVVGHVVARCA
jgi:hypothetical protein